MVNQEEVSNETSSSESETLSNRFRNISGFYRLCFLGFTIFGVLLAAYQILGLQVVGAFVFLENSYLY